MNDSVKVGWAALIERFGLNLPTPAVVSEVGPGARRTFIENGHRREHYTPQYLPQDTVCGHLRFALRYEPVDMAAMVGVMRLMDPAELAEWLRAEPTGQYARRAWFFYEWATGKLLDVPDAGVMKYVPALSEDMHITAAPVRSSRHKIEDNLLGVPGYCPTVRRTEAIVEYQGKRLDQRAREVLAECEPDILARAVSYLFSKETTKSFEIEHEVPSNDKAERFVRSLKEASRVSLGRMDDLIALQNRIVNPKYAAEGLRDFQNFVGETAGFDYTEVVHFICPRPEDIHRLMRSWHGMSERIVGQTDPVVAAALASFGFVFLHPFEDGNGRIHRFLIHKILSDEGFTPDGALFPVSASIMRDMAGYDRCLEAFSKSIHPFIDWRWTSDKEVEVLNETHDLYAYFDATPQVEYLYGRIENTIEVDLKEELTFLARFDASLRAVNAAYDMPNRKAALFTKLALQNNGRLSGGKRKKFPELDDDEVTFLEKAIRIALEDLDEGDDDTPPPPTP